MAEATLGRNAWALPQTRVEAREWVIAHWDVIILAALMIAGFALRFFDLGSRALHHDESLHAQFSHYLYDGAGYKHDPLMHGPFLFHISAAVYFLFGATDATSRFAPSLFGVALIGLPWLLKKQIGTRAVLSSALFICFSPTLLYFSRFDRNEAWMAFWTLGIVICIWRYLDDRRDGWLYAMAALMALSFASKEVTFITVAIMLVFVNLMLAVDLGKARLDEAVQADTASRLAVVGIALIPLALLLVTLLGGSSLGGKEMLLRIAPFVGGAWLLAVGHSLNAGVNGKPADPLIRTVAFAPVAFAVAALWPLIGQRPFGRDVLPPIGDVMIVLGTMALPQYAAGIQVLPFVGNDGYFPLSTVTTATPEDNLRITTVVVLLIMSLYVGLLWKPKVWAICAAAFYLPYVILYTTLFTNQPAPWTNAFWHGRGGFFSGIWGSLDYWLDQHHVKRGNQPVYYYALVTPLYEFLPMLLALGGAVWLVLKGDSFKRWLLFWLAGIFLGLSIAGEKMPWLEVHIALPLALLGGVVLAKALDALDFSGVALRQMAALAAVTVLAVLLLVVSDSADLRWLGWGLLALALGFVMFVFAAEDTRAAARGALTISMAVLLTLTVRAGTMASFSHGDVPVEMLVYTQTSPNIPDLRDRIDTLARESGLGLNLPIVVDSSDGFSWPGPGICATTMRSSTPRWARASARPPTPCC